jgi:hypothetical protein
MPTPTGSAQAPPAPSSELWIESDRLWYATRPVLLSLLLLIPLAGLLIYLPYVTAAPTAPWWAWFLASIGLALFLAVWAWAQSWQVPRRIQITPEGLWLLYPGPGKYEVWGPWANWKPVGGSRWLGGVWFQNLQSVPYYGVSSRQARSILISRWAPRWALPTTVRVACKLKESEEASRIR